VQTVAAGMIAADVIEEQLRRVQSSPQFNHSRRYPSFLQYVVRETLKGHQDELKERTIGIEAFGRTPGYDLNADPIVRVTAGEVRKRLAQYYYEPAHKDELRIELRPGSYVPEFKFIRGSNNTQETIEPAALDFVTAPNSVRGRVENELSAAVPTPKKRARVAMLVCVVLVAGVIGGAVMALRVSPFEQFWQPVIDSPSPVLIAVGSAIALVIPAVAANDTSVGGHPLSSDPIALADVVAVSGVQQVLSRRAKASTIQSSAQTSFSDLQRGPAILISGFNNPWTMRLTAPLRFHFVRSSLDSYEIEDRADPNQKSWTLNTMAPFSGLSRDYGIVARFQDPTTEQIIVVAAGIGENGTIAASKLLSNRGYFAQFRREGLLPKQYQNWEAVIETEIIDGKPGPPRIVATYCW